MRILHTSDWHLGLSRGATSLGPDHDRFLDWLERELAERRVDALVIAGDVFDHMQPSAEAQARYYAFLGRVGRTGVRQVVVIGGNHDSASRLDAPAEVLKELNVHVVGGIGGTPDTWERCVVPLHDRAGELRAIALAVPYVHEFRLGVRTTDLDHQAVRAAFTERFGALYRYLVDRARERFPGLPLVATGHLTVGAASREDYPHEIHQVGTIDGLPASVLDPRIQYTALGHIHRSYPVDERRRAWYSGCPVASSLSEAKTPRKVLMVDLSDDPDAQPTVTKITVPAPRGLLELRGSPDAILAAARNLSWSQELPPLLFCRAIADALPSTFDRELREVLGRLAEDERPVLLELRQERATPLPPEEEEPTRALHELEPSEVFASLCRTRAADGDVEPLKAAFATLASATADDFQAMIADARGDA